MTSACEFANKVCEINNPVQLLTSHNQVLDRLLELKRVALPDIDLDQTKPPVQTGLVMDRMQELRKVVNNFNLFICHMTRFLIISAVVVACVAFFVGFLLGLYVK